MKIPDTNTQASIYHAKRLQLVPIDAAGKKPAVNWKDLQTRPETERFINSAFPAGQSGNLAAVHGAISGNSVCLDYDCMSYYHEDTRNDKIRRLYDYLPKVESRRGRHILFRTEKPLKTKTCLFGAGTVDIKASGSYSLLPFSEIGGQMYLPFSTDIEKVDLPVIDTSELPARYHDFIEIENRPEYTQLSIPIDNIIELSSKTIKSKHAAMYGLSARTCKILAGQWLINGDRSSSIYHAIVEMAGNGYTLSHVYETIMRFGAPSVKARLTLKSDAWLENAYMKAREYVQSHKAETAQQAERLMHAVIQGAPIPGFTARTQHTAGALVIAIAEIIRRTARTDVYMSVRELAELSGLHINTTHKALKQLNLPIIEQHPYYRVNRYDTKFLLNKINARTQMLHTNTCMGVSMSHVCPPDVANHDLFTAGGVGKAGFKVYYHFCDNIGELIEAPHIARTIGINARTARRKVNQLCEIGLIEPDTSVKGKRLYVMTSVPGIDELNQAVTVLEDMKGRLIAGTGERRKSQHNRDRARNDIKRMEQKKRKAVS